MSINVTVNGNPISIKRGTMVTANTDEDFQKRRKMRMEQVRQQSKDIAESVRNKVKKAKSKQLTSFEKQASSKLDEFKNRKLLELQNQYRECLQDVGLAHVQAKIDEVEEQEERELKEKSQKVKSQERGEIAREMQQISTNERNLKEAVPIQTKKMVREIENARAAMISKKRETPKKKRMQVVHEVSDTLSESDFPSPLMDVSNNYSPRKQTARSSSPSRGNMTELSSEPITFDTGQKISSYKNKKSKEGGTSDEANDFSPRKQYVTKSKPRESTNMEKSKGVKQNVASVSNKGNKEEIEPAFTNHSITGSEESSPSSNPCAILKTDTRISERIRNRRIHPSTSHVFDTKETLPKPKSIHEECSCCPCSKIQHQTSCCNSCCKYKKSSPRTDRKMVCKNIGHDIEKNIHICSNEKANQKTVDTRIPKSIDLPDKPTISLKDSSGPLSVSEKKEYSKVQYYDHNNRFASNFIIDNTNVERIPEECIQVCPREDNEEILNNRNDKNEKQAEKRGKQAMQKEKIQKDYVELMNKLPALKKQERISALDPTKDKFHMTRTRLEEHEKNRQHKIETAFEKLIPKTITLTTKQSDELKKISGDVLNNEPVLNIGTWQNQSVEDEEQNDNLNMLIAKLKSQKELLLQESKQLPKNSNLGQIIKDFDAAILKENTTSPRKNSFKAKDKTRKVHKTSSLVSSASPKRKSTKRSRSEVLILQNMSTQTSPKIMKTVEINTTPLEVKKSVHDEIVPMKRLCECDAGNDRVCEILIKIPEGKKSEVIVSSPQKKDISIDFDKRKENLPKVEEKKKKLRKMVEDKKFNSTKRSSWKDQLSKNDTNFSSSTSYYSPPDYTARNNTNVSNLLNRKPQQSNIDINSKHQNKIIDPRLLTYIKKLLLLSKESVEDLGVTSVSEISTPSSSIINAESNNPTNKLINVLKFFNLNFEDLMHNLNISNNRSDSNKTRSSLKDSRNVASFEQTDITNQSNSIRDGRINESRPNKMQNTSPQDTDEIDFSNVIAAKYSELANSCQERINNLAAMIEQVRNEKQQILSPNSDKENITSYLTLPSQFLDSISENSNSPEQKELTEKLLQINLENGKKVDAEGAVKNLINSIKKNKTEFELEPEIVQRYLNLLNSEAITKDTSTNPENLTSTENTFVPVLSNIPKLPKFTQQTKDVQQTRSNKHPPPSKGLNMVAKKFNGEISIAPHELSTIPEADSTRRSKSPESSQKSSPRKMKITESLSPKQGNIINASSPDIIQLIENIRINLSKPDIKSPSDNSSKSPQTYNINTNPESERSPKTYTISNNTPTLTVEVPPETTKESKSPQPSTSRGIVGKEEDLTPLQIANIIQKLQDISTDSSTDKSELGIEGMLKNMGMGWAIATIRKTQEALARQSSSTSSFENQTKTSESSSDVSLKAYLTVEAFKHSSSASKSDLSISPYLKEFQDISAIQGTAGTIIKHQRTSTPVQSTDKSKSGCQCKTSGCKCVCTKEESTSNLSENSNKSNNGQANFITLPDMTGSSTVG